MASKPAIPNEPGWPAALALGNDHKLTIGGVTEKGFEGLERLFTTQLCAGLIEHLDSQRGATEPKNGGCMTTWSTMGGC